MSDLHFFKMGSEYSVYLYTVQDKLRERDASGVYFSFSNATEINLIDSKEGFKRYFKDGAWHYVVDNIGTEYWDEDGTKHMISELGEEVLEVLGLIFLVDVMDHSREQTNLSSARRDL
jgi:hypothetical protein